MAVKIDPDTFVEKFAAQFEEADAASISGGTAFRDLTEWSSMQSLIVIASFDWEYGVTITAEELRQATTVMDLYNVLHQKVS